MKCGDCKHWKRATEHAEGDDFDENPVPMADVGFCMRIEGPAIQASPDCPLRYDWRKRLGERIAAPCDGEGYSASLLTRDSFGCVLFEAVEERRHRMNIDPPRVRVHCTCGHEVQYHSKTSGRCLLQNLDESECSCRGPTPKHAIIGDDVYELVRVTGE